MELDEFLADKSSAADPLHLDDVFERPSAAGAPSVLDVPKPRRPPAKGPPPPRVHPVQLQFFRDPPPHVKPYVTNACYYANQIALITREGAREKRGIVINDSNVYIMGDGSRVEQTIPLTQVEAMIMQDVLTPKSLGISKEWQTHVLLHLRDFPDLFFALAYEEKHDPTTRAAVGSRTPALETVLTGLLWAYDVDLLVCSLREEESIQQLLKRTVTDVGMRRECDEILAYRTGLTTVLKGLLGQEVQLVASLNKIRVASASQAVRTLLKEIVLIEGKNEAMMSALDQASASLDRCLSKERELRESLEVKEREIQSKVDARLAAQQSEIIARHALDYEIMTSAHQTEMRHLGLLCDLLQASLERCRKSPAVTVGELETELAALQRLRQAVLLRKGDATEKLAEAKRSLIASKAALQQAKEEVDVLRQLPPGEPVPPSFNRGMAPTFLPVHLSQSQLESPSADLEETVAPQSSVRAGDAKGTAVVLLDDDDDDDNIDFISLPEQLSANTHPNLLVDDDDL
ncbi:hypothetical protein TraAM80_03046 [Trypanosoma rangeli]|uniref:Uncharacterized protein n=1 Tax=Trypanosoma rangeli TaxID=5698 RepID=A0A422NRT7_TRYRA|nr:uncharacterized protein TraAM80_03046 [Trypanosoma rangeli]RNF08190.1 hypothetical protein TraAM80_03046 [Trypanosoma rangeli]|eukprot:RNF08190.1 hypothetical protein TraAM80_03046 [Trypanosoma rangeli]